MNISKEKYPKQVQIFISEVCFENCAYCPYTAMRIDKKRELLRKELTIKQWKEAAQYLYDRMGIRLFMLIGGEPTVKKGLEEFVEFLNGLPGAEILCCTSGIPLLKNEDLERRLIDAGLRNFIVSVDGIKTEPDLNINIDQELKNLKKGSERKSVLGLYYLLMLRKKYPDASLCLSSGCIINKETIDYILPTYQFLAKHQIYLNLCPEQTLCFGGESDTLLTDEDKDKVSDLANLLVSIKKKKGNYLIPSIEYLRKLPTIGINQSFKCSEYEYPTTIHITSDGNIPFCNWRRGEINFNILDLVSGKRTYQNWLALWKDDQEGKRCSCSWSFVDRVNDYCDGSDSRFPNTWYKFV